METQDQYENDYGNIPYQPSQEGEQILKYLLDTSQDIENLEHILKGEVYDEKEDRWHSKYDPIINKQGLSMVMALVRTHMTKTNKASILKEEEIHSICLHLRKRLAEVIAKKWREFGMQREQLDIFMEILDNAVFTHLATSQKGELLNLMKKTMSIVQSQVEHKQAQQGNGFLGGLVNRK